MESSGGGGASRKRERESEIEFVSLCADISVYFYLWEANSSPLEDHLLLSKDFFFFSPVGCQRLERKRSHLFIYLIIYFSFIPGQRALRVAVGDVERRCPFITAACSL